MSAAAMDATAAIPLNAIMVKVIGSAFVGCEVTITNTHAITRATMIFLI
jgi:hypothetical protein